MICLPYVYPQIKFAPGDYHRGWTYYYPVPHARAWEQMIVAFIVVALTWVLYGRAVSYWRKQVAIRKSFNEAALATNSDQWPPKPHTT